ncbi:EAL domain-containing protein [Marinomonas sp. 5E14-1]|uniref:sensor domain-containing protein n=1 Tax=Marinomonas sp. 5E14-1 TaxID=3153922 RepID=UPI0032648579
MPVDIHSLQTAVWIYDIDHSSILWANKAALELWDSSSLEELIDRDLKTDQSVAVKESLLQYQQAFKQNQVIQENWYFSPKGKEIQAFCQFSGIELDNGRMGMLVEATTANPLHSNILSGSTTILSVYSLNGEFISGNPPFIKSFGNNVTNLTELICDSDVLSELKSSLVKNIKFEKDVLMNTPQGQTWFKIQAMRSRHEQNHESILLHHYDIHERKTLEQNLREEAHTDPLTGLLNRRGLTYSLKKSLSTGTPFSLIYIDLDGFKMVNDSLGHGLGDKVLIEVCQRLKELCTEADQLCRFGGDEFILISNQNKLESHYAERCHALLESLSEPYKTLKDRNLSLSASIGISHFPSDSENIEHLITCADAAMYEAKKQGKKRWIRYQEGMELQLKRLSRIAHNLALAIEKQELALHYQPIKNISTNEIISFEALLRWTNKELGYVNTEEVIQVAEETGLINDIENWVLKTAIQDLTILRNATTSQATMSVNISGLHISEPNFVKSILSILERHNLKADDLNIELTESALLTNANNTHNPIQQFTFSNIKINIDDFGTGYSSLAYLHSIPASIVKVDRSFLESIEHNTVTLECIHRLVTALNMTCLIEGIETPEQAEKLKAIGYDLQQGYFHGKPQSLDYYLKNAQFHA